MQIVQARQLSQKSSTLLRFREQLLNLSEKMLIFRENLQMLSQKCPTFFYKYIAIFSLFSKIFKEKSTLAKPSQIIMHFSYFCIYSQVIFAIRSNPSTKKQLSKSAIPVPVVELEFLKSLWGLGTEEE